MTRLIRNNKDLAKEIVYRYLVRECQSPLIKEELEKIENNDNCLLIHIRTMRNFLDLAEEEILDEQKRSKNKTGDKK